MESRIVDTERLRVKLVESGPEDGIPVVLVHGNLSTGRFFEHLMPGAPDRYRDAGGGVEMELFEGSGHFPPVDAEERFTRLFFGFLESLG